MDKASFRKAKGFIYADVQREIDLAKKGKDSGNFLAALGLLCYTEFAGGVKRNIFQHGQASRNFNSFFDDLGPDYKAFRASHDVYDIFRCGLAHEYFVKRNCTIYIIKGTENIGLGINNDGSYYFVVERYFNAFKIAFDILETSRGLLSER